MARLLFNKYKRDRVRVLLVQGKGHMVRQYTQPKRPMKYTWFMEKMLLINDLDAYNSDCDVISSAKAVLMDNLSSYDLDVLYMVPQHDTYQNDDMLNQTPRPVDSTGSPS
ncbi:hypothetical protein Tco_1060178 [Tanacetum coccineum]